MLTAPRRDTVKANGASGTAIALGASPAPSAKDSTAVSIYRGSAGGGFRPSASAPQHSDTGTAAADTSGPISLRALTDSVDLALPDTSEFTFRPYHVRYAPDYVARPTLGYERDNFGRGIYGGTAIQLSDMLGNHTLVFAASVNGRPSEAQAFAGYINQAHRLNWVAAASQDPFYFYAPSGYSLQPYDQAGDTAVVLTTRLQRFVVRQAEARGYYPFNRFDRLELGMQFVNIDQAILEENDFFLPGNGAYIGTTFDQVARPSVNFLQPQLALVHDNALNYYVGPISGSRWRFEIAPAIGDWRFVQGQADYRRYFFARPFTLAVRGKFWGRYGRDGDLFPVFLGNTELIRGYTAGSFRSGECVQAVSTNSQTGCAELDQLIGSRVAVANVELRFPLTRYLVLGFLPIGFPPIEGALFYDAGVAWNGNSVLKLSRSASDNVELVRAPLRSYGTSIRVNMFGYLILRADYTKPLNRPQKHAYWTVSLGQTF